MKQINIDIIKCLFIATLIFLLMGIGKAYASQTYSCGNKASWESSSGIPVYDYYDTPIRPDGSPAETLDFAEQLDVLYDKDLTLKTVGSASCYGALSCLDETGYDFTKPFDSDHPAWINYNQCTCTHPVNPGCNNVTWYRAGYTSLKSGKVGTKFPAYPTPTYPSDWKTRRIYKHSYADDITDSNISLNILSNIDSKFKTGGSATIETCEEGSTTIDGKEVVLKYYIVKGLGNHEQTFNATQPYQEWVQSWGMCGKANQYWLESDQTYVNYPAVELHVPIIVSIGIKGYSRKDKEVCAPNAVEVEPNQCKVFGPNPNNNTCPSGYTYKYGAFGSSHCYKIVQESPQPCVSPWEQDPDNSGKCRKGYDSVVPDVDVDEVPDEDEAPDWCTATGDSWDGDTSTCTHADDSGGGTVAEDDTGTDGSGEKEEEKEEDKGEAEDFFKDAPVAKIGGIGSKTLTKDGFYTPSYGPKITFTSLLEDQLNSSGVDDMTAGLDGLAPPVYKLGGLPKVCIPRLSFSDGEICIDLEDYDFVFDAITIFFYFTAIMTSWRIIIGAK